MNKKNTSFLVIISILLVSMNMRPAITSIAPLLETIQSELGLNSTMVSLLTAIPVVCMGLFAPVAPLISGRVGLERSVSYCLFIIAAATGMRYLADDATVMLASAGVIGIGLAVAGPSISGTIKRHFPDKAPMMIGVYSVGIGLGASLGAGITIPIQNLVASSWTAALASWSMLALLSLFIWIYATKNMKTVASRQPSTNRFPRFPWNEKRAILIMLFFGLQGSLNYSVTAWLAPISQTFGLTTSMAGTILTTFTIVQTVTGFIIPILVSKYSNRLFWMLLSSFSMLLGLISLSFFKYETIPWISSVLLGVGSGALFFLALLLPLDNTKNAEEAGAWTSMVQCGGYIIAGLGPAFTGLIVDISGIYENAFIMMSFLCIVMMAICFALFYNQKNK
ncbi:CynX/NimT family MFS transporter [Gorillibacterium massiliense]|uniref:MFS transporter n=1 Tax=Gorillibacterium massiliense TaxID=1280390 RepID=UPI0004B112A7|nr:MFS transporter [Gorillibacterium massiliense]